MFSATEFSSNFSAKGKITDRQSYALFFFFEEELNTSSKKYAVVNLSRFIILSVRSVPRLGKLL